MYKFRTQSVQVGSSQSDVVFVKTGFPQGSVLGGPKYTMHTTPLDELIDLHDVDNQAYADDSNLYISFDLRSETATAQAFSQMEHCLADVEFWMTKNELQLNCSKTVVVLFKPPNLDNFGLKVCPLEPAPQNLEVPWSCPSRNSFDPLFFSCTGWFF